MKALVTKFSQMTDCISLDRFVPVATEALLEQKAGKLMILNEFLAGQFKYYSFIVNSVFPP